MREKMYAFRRAVMEQFDAYVIVRDFEEWLRVDRIDFAFKIEYRGASDEWVVYGNSDSGGDVSFESESLDAVQERLAREVPVQSP